MFELSAFAKRAGPSRLDLVPLHVPLRQMGWIICLGLFQISMMTLLIPTIGPAMVEAINANPLVGLVIFTTAWFVPGVPVVLAAELEAREIEEATRALRHFKLADAECYSAEDREAILGLISKWWTDRESGVSDPERLRQLGFHRFERFVRYELVPQLSVLAGGDWSASSFLAIYVIGIHGWVLDLLTYGPGLTVYHTLATVLYAAFMAGFWLPPTFATIQFIGGVAWRAGRRGWPPKLAFALALAASVVALLVINLLMYTLPFPNVVLDPEWRFPDDGIDEFGQKILKIQVVFAMYAVGAASLFFCG